jgi:hypothetical protein
MRYPTAPCSTTFNKPRLFFIGATGYSATHQAGYYHGMELHSLDWSIQPMDVVDAHTSFFSDRTRFPEGTVELDCALVMRASIMDGTADQTSTTI